MKEYWIGIDGTDSPWGGCTTWTISNIIDVLVTRRNAQCIFLDYPFLIRLNPNIPEKTRGNGALALHLKTSLSSEELLEIVTNQVRIDQEHYKLNDNKLPGVVVATEKPPEKFYYHALCKYETKDLVQEYLGEVQYWPELNQSHIGAMAAISADVMYDFTFELLAYRKLENCNNPRQIDDNSIKLAAKTYSSTFSSYDFVQSRELIAPSGPDPVFCGIRGETSTDLIKFYDSLKFDEELEGFTIFQTNQATDAHSRAYFELQSNNSKEHEFAAYEVFSGNLQLIENPREIQGGHIFAKCRVGSTILDVAWFEPTKDLRNAARSLIQGDIIFINGGVIPREDRLNVHVEYMRIIDLKEKITYSSPRCDCGNRMTSAGAFAGYKCKSCGETLAFPDEDKQERSLVINQEIFAAKSAQRHLTRPRERKLSRNRGTSEKVVPLAKFRSVF